MSAPQNKATFLGNCAQLPAYWSHIPKTSVQVLDVNNLSQTDRITNIRHFTQIGEFKQAPDRGIEIGVMLVGLSEDERKFVQENIPTQAKISLWIILKMYCIWGRASMWTWI